ncbi:hypothetical protein [Gorillibacterium timonense]|nr:hypothetical protein [Gorillibacterium timonense]
MTKHEKRPGDEPDKVKHTGEKRNGRKSMIKNESTTDSLYPNEYVTEDQ